MQSKILRILLSSLILMAGYLPPVIAVTDAELEALEKQIEQQEAEEKEKAETERKAKAGTKRKTEEDKRLAVEQKRLEGEKEG